MPAPLVVLLCVGLTRRHLGADTPHLAALAGRGVASPLGGIIPAVTTAAQTTMLTGVLPNRHGIVGNGWFFSELGEVLFWRQSQRLVEAEHLWTAVRRNRPYRVFKHFWWYAMHTDVDATMTPRPVYHHDGRKSPDCYAWPRALKDAVNERLGTFPLFSFWGPTAGIAATDWIADAYAVADPLVQADLSLVYLPHLDYDLQRFGPVGPHLAPNLRALDAAAGRVIAAAHARGARVVVVSEYGIGAVDHACAINRRLRERGLLIPVTNAAGELIDTGVSRAFAVCDHQIAHIYTADSVATAAALAGLPGLGRLVGGAERAALGLDHPRSGDLIALAEPGSWFVHDWWLDPGAAPDFARCVEIHKKPGYDPRELLFDPAGGRRRAGVALLRKMLGLRYVMDPCPADPGLVRGSHGLAARDPEDGPVLIAEDADWARPVAQMTDLASAIGRHALS
jgi:predicted AlkP superfamily pyrophosphatase or phosphodiesterase